MLKTLIRTQCKRTGFSCRLIALMLLLASSAMAIAQQVAQAQPATFAAALEQPSFAAVKATAAIEPAPVAFVSLPKETPRPHGFWDRKNCALFAGTAALSAADFYVTRQNLANGGTELNPVTRVFGRSTAGLAVNFSAQTASVIGLSYLFHKTGHHKLERMTTLVNMSASATAVSYDLAHR